MPVSLTKGTKYEIDDTKVEITQYERGKVYAAHFITPRLELQIKYITEDNDDGVLITFSEDMLSFDREKHGKLQTMFYNWQLKMGAKKELKRMGDNVYANMVAQNHPLSMKKAVVRLNYGLFCFCFIRIISFMLPSKKYLRRL